MEEILHQLIGGLFPLCAGFQPSKVMQDFFHSQYQSTLDITRLQACPRTQVTKYETCTLHLRPPRRTGTLVMPGKPLHCSKAASYASKMHALGCTTGYDPTSQHLCKGNAQDPFLVLILNQQKTIGFYRFPGQKSTSCAFRHWHGHPQA